MCSGDVADFSPIRHAAARVDLEVRKNGRSRIEVSYFKCFFAGAHAALEYFVLISGAPVGSGRKFRGRVFFEERFMFENF